MAAEESLWSAPVVAGSDGSSGLAASWERLALPVTLSGIFLTILDFSIVNVAIPSIQRGLHASGAEIQFVVAGYSLTYGAGLMTGGRLGDRFGRRRLFMIGLVLFTVTSVACGAAPTAVTLVIARFAQGAAASVMFPQVLSIMNVTYVGVKRVRAFTWYAIVLGTGFVGGQVIGGVLIRFDPLGLGWRACFLINVPFGVAALLLAGVAIRESRSETTRKLDLLGVLLVTGGLLMLLFPLVEGRQEGWPVWSFVCLALSFPVLWLFLTYQDRLYRRGQTPLIEPVLLRSRSFLMGIGTVFAAYAGLASFFLVFAVYLQEGEGFAPLGAGVAVLPLGIGFLVITFILQRATKLVNDRTISYGAVLMAVSEAALAIVVWAEGAHVSAWSLAPALTGAGVGLGFVLTPLISRALAGVDPNHAGAASGMLSTTQQVGISLGVGLIGVIFYGAATGSSGVLYAHAFAYSMVYTVACALVVSVLALGLPGAPRPASG